MNDTPSPITTSGSVTPLGSLCWRKWHATIPTRIREFTTVLFPGFPEPFWSDAALDRVQAEYATIFPTLESVTARDNHHTTDLFVTWIGEMYICRARGLAWYSHPHAASTVYHNFGPALSHPPGRYSSTYVIELLEWAAQDGFETVRAELWSEVAR